MNCAKLTRFLWTCALGVSVACLGSLLVSQLISPSNAVAAEDPKVAPAWELKDVEGKAVKLSDFKGKVVVLDFWATWCPPCREEIPGFIELQKQYGKDGLVVIGVSLDEEGPSVVKPFIKKTQINYTIVMGNQEIAKAYGDVESIPTTFIIDGQGKIVKKHVGFSDKAAFEKDIKPLLKK